MIKIDPEIDTFLLDHVVDGTPLLSTVMQLDLVARETVAGTAAMPAGRPAAIRFRDIRLGLPVRFGGPGARQLELECVVVLPESAGRAALYCQLRSQGTGRDRPDDGAGRHRRRALVPRLARRRGRGNRPRRQGHNRAESHGHKPEPIPEGV